MDYIKVILIWLRFVRLLPDAIWLHLSSLFSARFYTDNYPDVTSFLLMPELHFLRYGQYERRNPHPLFDTSYYIKQVPDFFRYRIDPVRHFVTIGSKQFFDPHPLFDTRYYDSQCSTENMNALEHYLFCGDKKSLNPNPLFSGGYYCSKKGRSGLVGSSLEDYLMQGAPGHLVNYNMEILTEVNTRQNFQWHIERFSTFQGVLFISGWAFAPDKRILRIGYQTRQGGIKYFTWPALASDDLVAQFGVSATDCRFAFKLFDDLPANHLDIILVVQFTDGSVGYAFQLWKFGLAERPHGYFLQDKFIAMLKNDHSPAKVLEIGSRARSGFVSKEPFVPTWMDYTGTDIVPGENVDLVCDAHELSAHFPPGKFDYIFSLNVFEHILMPWKVVLEVNVLLKIGGKVMVFTHQTMPLHDTPCDYWRFSDTAWHALFNRDTGFRILYCGMGDPVDIVAQKAHEGSYGLSLAPAYLHSMVIAEKTTESLVEWNVQFSNTGEIYPPTVS